MRAPSLIHCAMLAALTAGSTPTPAQVQRSGSDSQRIMQQYQQLAAERTSLQSQVADQKKELDAAKASLAAVTKERDALKARVGASAGAAAQLTTAKQAEQVAEQSLEKYKQSMNELIVRFRETATNLKTVELDRDKARKDLAESSTAFDQCASDNIQLYDISHDILNRYEHVGLFTRISASEPFTQITRTRLENLVEEYRARAEQSRVKKAAP